VKRASYPFVVFSLAAFFLLTFSLFVSAAEPIQATKEPVEIYNPFYTGVFGGWVIPEELKVENGEKVEIKLNQSGAVGAKVGYIFPIKWLAVELEYTFLSGQHADAPKIGYFRAHNAMGNLILRYPEGVIRPYIGGGAGWSWGNFAKTEDGDTNANAFGWQALAGINLEIIPSLSVDFGYRYFSSKYKIDDLNVNNTVGDHMLLVGLNYHFGGAKPVEQVQRREEPAAVVAPPVVKEKKCPNTPQCCIVDADGCPIDSDKDGVCDGCDKCPDTPLGCIVDEDGCPKDSDKDGVCDGLDKCPDTPAGVAVDKDGCPLPPPPPVVEEVRPKVEKEIVEKGRTTLNVLFDFDKSTIKGNYSNDIDALADVMKKYEDLNVKIEGHTDNINRSKDPNYNKKLSQRRANAVKKYLVEKSGIDAKRLTAIGFGSEKPIASNKTKEGRQKNRRVEAVADYIIKR